MQSERIRDPGHPLFREAMALYRQSFPPHEQRLIRSQEEILRNSAYHFDVISDDGTFIGMILYWEIAGFLYIEHFCILPEKRNRHYGQRILGSLGGRPLILEIDPPSDAISVRRRGFYERCGFAENPYPHVHPPYHPGNPGHPLVVMSAPRVLTPQEYDTFACYLRDTVMHDAWREAENGEAE